MPPGRARLLLLARKAAARAATEYSAEQIAEIDIFAAETATKAATRTSAKSLLPEPLRHRRIAVGIDFAAIETGAFVRIGQEVVGPGDGAEALGRLGTILVFVGVKLLGELAIGGLDVLLARVPCHAQGLVRVCCHGPKLGLQWPSGKARFA